MTAVGLLVEVEYLAKIGTYFVLHNKKYPRAEWVYAGYILAVKVRQVCRMKDAVRKPSVKTDRM